MTDTVLAQSDAVGGLSKALPIAGSSACWRAARRW